MDNDIVEVDKHSPRFQRAKELMNRMVTAERVAMLGKAQALDLRQSDVDDSPSDLWGGMPVMGKEHDLSAGDVSKRPPRSELDEQEEVSPC